MKFFGENFSIITSLKWLIVRVRWSKHLIMTWDKGPAGKFKILKATVPPAFNCENMYLYKTVNWKSITYPCACMRIASCEKFSFRRDPRGIGYRNTSFWVNFKFAKPTYCRVPWIIRFFGQWCCSKSPLIWLHDVVSAFNRHIQVIFFAGYSPYQWNLSGSYPNHPRSSSGGRWV